jgi:hypothetical protein
MALTDPPPLLFVGSTDTAINPILFNLSTFFAFRPLEVEEAEEVVFAF